MTSKNCHTCNETIQSSSYLECSKCNKNYDLTCANLTEKAYKALTQSYKKSWLCPNCTCSRPKGEATPTPNRLSTDGGSKDIHNKTAKLTTTRSSKPKTKPNKENSLSLTDLTDPTLLTEIRLLRQEISDMKAQNVEISLLPLENQTKVREELETAQKSIIDLKCTVTQLQQRLNFQEQNELRNEIEIIGIPELNNENLAHVIQVTSQKIGIQLAETDIDYMSRIGPKQLSLNFLSKFVEPFQRLFETNF
ncbi:hypothetical protein K1T71_013038 [Dendrolimus kikuchii]|uniref:Uncharacterized protein n=1 Tax=Dendrolimus kikuchii TaxID=765133 RepID=A0ACC1CIU4_9NEOP|nr:hypothetical protein K1T71_013038 [Dendrolimus kikuchii]